MDPVSTDYRVVLGVCGLAALATLLLRKGPQDALPTVGVGSFPLAAQVASLRSITQFHAWVWEGYQNHKGGIFRVRLLRDWRYIVNGSKLIDELRRVPEDVLSFTAATAENLQSDYTPKEWQTKSHADLVVIPTKLNRKLETIMPAVTEEITAAFEEEITSRLDPDGWTTMTVGEAIMRTVCRASNRMILGLPLCRNAEYIALCEQHAVDVILSATLLRNVPALLRPLVGRYLVPVNRSYAKAECLMSECITERMRRSREGAEDLPDDYLQWLIDAGDPCLQSVTALISHILRLNLAAIHSTAVTFTFALYQLAAQPEMYQEPIRREADAILSQYGWTKAGMDHMRMLDSLLRETQRFHGIGAVSLDRKAMRDYTFSNGMVVKKGQLVSAATRATHRDPTIYANPETFDGFRFYEPESSDPEPSLANRMTTLSLEYLTFGSGRHACPGRFWATNEVKTMMAYFLTHYEARMEQDGVVPREQWIGSVLIPDRNARVLIRKRRTP